MDKERELELELIKCQAKVELLMEMIAKGGVSPKRQISDDAYASWCGMTKKQHGASQMLVRGATNQEIADRFGVELSTAKVYVRGVMGHFGIRTRTALAAKLRDAIGRVGDEEYMNVTGIPKDWDFRGGDMRFFGGDGDAEDS